MRDSSFPVVSIVIPTYNHAEFLQVALDSVIQQTFTSWEAIVVNNYSDDNTEAIVSSFLDDRIILINFHNNGIIAASRNQAIKIAKGKYVAFLDSDDMWFPTKLQECINKLNESGCGAVCHAERWIYMDNSEKDIQYGPSSKTSYNSLLYNGNKISTSAVVVKTEILHKVGMFSEEKKIVTAEDYDLWLNIVRSGEQFTFLTNVLGVYRIHPNGSSQLISKNISAILKVIENHHSLKETVTVLESLYYRRAISLMLCSGGRSFQKNGNFLGALKIFFFSWKKNPFSLRLYVSILLSLVPFKIRTIFDK